MPKLGERLKRGWNAFLGRDPTIYNGYSSSYRPDRRRMNIANVRTIVNAIYNHIAVDVSSININHVRLNEKNQYLETINSPLNKCLTESANLDQTGRDLIRDLVLTIFDKGCAALVPVDTDVDPKNTDSYSIYSMRVGEILEWQPKHVLLRVYNEMTGEREEVRVEKRICAIIENPFYSVMNEPNSTAQRLVRTMSQLDSVNEEMSFGKIDLIVQLPYKVRGEALLKEAQNRVENIEAQLRSKSNSKYGIAYADATEKIVQLNRSIENNLWTQVKDLKTELFNQLGFSESIFNGTAKEEDMLNYNNRVVNPIVTAITEEMNRKFLSSTARTQRQSIAYFKDPFKLVPVNQIAEIADKFTRNEIMTSNEIRSVLGMKPASDPKADELRNSNLNHPDENGMYETQVEPESGEQLDEEYIEEEG